MLMSPKGRKRRASHITIGHMIELASCKIEVMRPSVIFLDFDGTICGSLFWGHWADDGKYSKTNRLIQERFFKTSPDILAQWMRGEYTSEDIVQRISKDIDISPDELLTGLRESCEQMRLFNMQILPAVKSLRQDGVKVVIATDNMDTFLRWTAPALNLARYFDAILDSYSLRALKRDKDELGQSKFFGKFFEENGIDPASTVLIDDGMHNAIVKDFGMRFIHVSPNSPAHAVLASLTKLNLDF